MKLFDEMIEETKRGWSVFNSCVGTPDLARYSNSNKGIFIFPDDDSLMLQTAFKYFGPAAENYDIAVVISSVNLDEIHNHTDKNLHLTYIDEDEMQSLLRYVSLICMPVCIVSLKIPYRQKPGHLVGFKDLTIDKVVCNGLYGVFANV